MASLQILEFPPEAAAGPGECLSREAALLAGRLADLLAQALPEEGPHIEGWSFLRALADTALRSGPEAPMRSPTDPLARLTEALQLSPIEVDLILLAGLPDEHEGLAGILRTLHPRGEPRPSVGLAAQLFCQSPAERILLREMLGCGAASRSGLLRLGEEAPFFERSLHLADGLWAVLYGLDVWPDSVQRLTGETSLSGLDAWFATPEVRRARMVLASRAPCTVLVTSDSEEIALQRAAALALSTDIDFIGLLFPAAPSPDLEQLTSVHCLARGVTPIIRFAGGAGPQVPEVPGFATYPRPTIVCARTGGALVRGGRPVVELPVERLGPAARRTMWCETLPELSSHASLLAARYTVEPDEAEATADDVRGLAALEGRATSIDDVALSVRTRAGFSLSSGVRLLRPTATWEHLVLPGERMAVLREALDRLHHQAHVLDHWGFLAGRPGARGVRMLFSGISGTGKTLAAEVMAHEIGVDLLLVDISRVVSKWIGETEKNLAEVFDVAERARAVLFFDEADALFGKRTEVSDAHDRYANLETAYLLTRLERFEGLAVLSTNLRQNIDSAFARRLEFVLEFSEPALPERVALWKCHLPPNAPLADDVGLPELAALYPVVGGLIRNAAVAAAFLAAADGTPITRSHLVRAIRREYDKSGRAFPGLPAGMAAP